MNPLSPSQLPGHPAPSPETGEARPRTAEDDALDAQLTQAENANLKERLARLEGSIAFWAADVDEAKAEVARVRGELEEARRGLRDAEDQRAALEDERAALIDAVEARDSHIAALEARITEFDLREIDDRRTRSRLEAIRVRVRSRMAAQAEEIEGLRRTVALGHAARRQVEDELRAARSDAARNARYLDRVEERLRLAGERLAGTPGPSATIGRCKAPDGE